MSKKRKRQVEMLKYKDMAKYNASGHISGSLNGIPEVLLYESGDYAKALKIIEPMGIQGNAKAQNLLGIMYSDGLGVRKNNTNALKWFRKAGEQDYFVAFNNLYFMYKNGKGTKKNSAEALKWLCKAGEQGDYYALIELVDMYRKGKFVKKDNTKVLKWLRKAAEQEHDFGLQELGLMYFEGNGVPQDYAEAAKLFRKASENNYGDVDDKLGLMYFQGLGVQQDYAEAAKCFNREAEFGNDECLKKLFDMYKKGLIRESDDISMVKLFRKAEEGDSDLQLLVGMRKQTYRDFCDVFCNKLSFFVVVGGLSMLLLAWYDWGMIVNLVTGPESKLGGYYVGLAAICGFWFGFGAMWSVTYQIAHDAQVGGIPFPVIFYEPESKNSKIWLDFYGSNTYTIVTRMLNGIYFSLASVAIFLTVASFFL